MKKLTYAELYNRLKLLVTQNEEVASYTLAGKFYSHYMNIITGQYINTLSIDKLSQFKECKENNTDLYKAYTFGYINEVFNALTIGKAIVDLENLINSNSEALLVQFGEKSNICGILVDNDTKTVLLLDSSIDWSTEGVEYI